MELAVLSWQEPPPPGRGPGGAPETDYSDLVTELQEHPGDWAKVLVTPHTRRAQQLATRISTGRIAAFRPGPEGGTFEAVTRQDPEFLAQSALWIRYINEEHDERDG